MVIIQKPIFCEICKELILQKERELIPKPSDEYKADMVISNDAYWNDAGLYTIIRTRRMFHKKCFEDMIKTRREELGWSKRNGDIK